ncbi:MAG: carboxypeptidase regulatory-like domain-containing protein [Acidimicrobiia bacterium]|nr:carboxypeptidase regulatory-like domain-containing protein [Acidimicrobiia bacterium]
MKLGYLPLQSVLIVAAIALVNQPELRPAARAEMRRVWRAEGPLAQSRDVSGDSRFLSAQAAPDPSGTSSDTSARRRTARSGSAGHTSSTSSLWNGTGSVSPTAASSEHPTHELRNASIVGQARTTSNVPVPFAQVVLRDPATGRVVDRAAADQFGHFVFRGIAPRRFLLELLSADGSRVLATTTATAEPATASAVLAGVPARQATLLVASSGTVTAVFGNVVAATAQQTLRAAVDANILRVDEPAATLSPRR